MVVEAQGIYILVCITVFVVAEYIPIENLWPTSREFSVSRPLLTSDVDLGMMDILGSETRVFPLYGKFCL